MEIETGFHQELDSILNTIREVKKVGVAEVTDQLLNKVSEITPEQLKEFRDRLTTQGLDIFDGLQAVEKQGVVFFDSYDYNTLAELWNDMINGKLGGLEYMPGLHDLGAVLVNTKTLKRFRKKTDSSVGKKMAA